MKTEVLQQEIRWLLDEKYAGKKTVKAKKDIARLEKGEHIDCVIGWVDFLGCRIDLSQRPFIPEPETEYWMGKVIEELRRRSSRNRAPYSAPYGAEPRPNPTISQTLSPPLRVLDVFAGSGCIGVAVLKHIPSAHVDFAEKEQDFVKQIEINTKINSIEPERYRVIQSDIFSHISMKYDVILANPPYIAEKRKHTVQQSVIDNNGPYKTIFGGGNGLLYTKPFLAEAKFHLNRRGVIYLEFDPPEKKKIEQLAQKFGYSSIECHKDQYNRWRYARIVF